MRIRDLVHEEIEAYHGSPHNFNRIASHRIKGHSLYGWGAYVTPSRRIAMLYAKRGKALSFGEIMFLLGFDQSGWIYTVKINLEESQLMNLAILDPKILEMVRARWPEAVESFMQRTNNPNKINNQHLYDFVSFRLKSAKKASQWFISNGIFGGHNAELYIIYDPSYITVVGREKIKSSEPIPPL